MTFSEMVSTLGLSRSEGTLLRYLSDAWRALRQTVPESHRSTEFEDILDWLAEIVRQTDSSLLDEWESLTAGNDGRPQALAADRPPPPLTANTKAFRAMVRNALFRRVELAARGRVEELGALDGPAGFDAEAWREALDGYYEEYDDIGTGPAARGPALFVVTDEPGHQSDSGAGGPGGRRWRVRQILDDPEGDRDWAITAIVDLDASDEAGTPVVRVVQVGPATG